MFKQLTILVITLVILLSGSTDAPAAEIEGANQTINDEMNKSEQVTGYWVMPDGSALIEVYRENARVSEDEQESIRLAVRIVALKEAFFTVVDEQHYSNVEVGTERVDKQNPKMRLRNRPLIGLTIASGLRLKDDVWQDGKIYDPGSGKSYSCRLTLVSDGFLQVRGYIGFQSLGRTMFWQRAQAYRESIGRMFNHLDEHINNREERAVSSGLDG